MACIFSAASKMSSPNSVPCAVFFDLEGTGFEAPRITQIGALACYLDRDLTEIASFSEYVNPERPVEREAERVTGKTTGTYGGCYVKDVQILNCVFCLENFCTTHSCINTTEKKYNCFIFFYSLKLIIAAFHHILLAFCCARHKATVT